MQTLVYFLIWGAFFFVMMRFGCGAHVMGHRNRHRHDGGTADTSQLTEGGTPTQTKEQSNGHHH